MLASYTPVIRSIHFGPTNPYTDASLSSRPIRECRRLNGALVAGGGRPGFAGDGPGNPTIDRISVNSAVSPEARQRDIRQWPLSYIRTSKAAVGRKSPLAC